MDILLSNASRIGRDLDFSCSAAAIFGLVSHAVYYIHGYRNKDVFGILAFHVLGSVALLAKSVSSLGAAQGITAWVAISTSYLVALFLSIGVYRLWFHRLSHFPGPLAGRLTKLYGIWMNRKWKVHEEYIALHEKYGDFVRTAPEEVTVLSIDAITKIYSPKSKFSKKNTGTYDFVHYNGEKNLDFLTSHEQHRERRKIWDKGLNSKAIDSYEPGSREVIHTWLDKLASLGKQPVNTTLFSTLIPFDNMGRVGFSTDFGTIQAGKHNRMLSLLESAFALMARLGDVSWPIALLWSFPRVGESREFEELAERIAGERERLDGPEKKDIMAAFLEDFRSEKSKAFFNESVVTADAQAILVGATQVDTISCTLGFSFYHLATNKSFREKMRAAVAPAFGKTLPGEFCNSDLQMIEYMDAFIQESLRMYPPAATNGPRMTPPEGVEIEGRFIPGGVAVHTIIMAYQRSPKFWREPLEFIPERWSARPDLIIDQRAFFPFLRGRYDCVGQRLAWSVLRLAIAYTVWHYDFELAPGEDGTKIFTEMRNQVILRPGPLECVFTKRLDEISGTA